MCCTIKNPMMHEFLIKSRWGHEVSKQDTKLQLEMQRQCAKSWKTMEWKTKRIGCRTFLWMRGECQLPRSSRCCVEVALAKCCKTKIQNKSHVSLLSREKLQLTSSTTVYLIKLLGEKKTNTQFITSCFPRHQRPDVFYEALWRVYSSKVALTN